MNITVFTSNQPRHIALIEALAEISDQVFVIQECTTVFPGEIADFYGKSDIMQQYFSRVISAEHEVFGDLRFTSNNVTQLVLKSGDLNMVNLSTLGPALNSDYYIIFGSSYIKGPLCQFLVEKQAINIHMGVSPYYRGSSCNFWALYDGNPELVGATIHMLSHGLDSGAMLFHAFPSYDPDPFVFGMKAVYSAQKGLIEYIKKGTLREFTPIMQNKDLELRYTRNKDFADDIAKQYLDCLPSMDFSKLMKREHEKFLNPYFG